MSKDKKLAQIFHFDLQGKRDDKYKFLSENSLASISWNTLEPTEPNYFFVKKDFSDVAEYENGFKIGDLFQVNVTGIKTHDDNNLVSLTPFSENNFKYDYRPFDCRFINYDLKRVVRARYSVMKHMLNDNISLIIPRQAVTDNWNHVQVSKFLSDNRIHYSNKGIPIVCPLYLYPDTNAQQTIVQTHTSTSSVQGRTPNLNAEIVKQIAEKLGLTFTIEKTSPNPSKGGGQDTVSNICESVVKNNLAENPSFGGDGGGPTPEKLERFGYNTANPAHYQLIKEMRDELKDNQTEAEKVMWEYLRNKKTGHKIRRQHIIDDFITDFVCLRKKVVIEIDGKIHLKQKEYDDLRTDRLNELGYEVIRFKNEEVFENPESVTKKIKDYLDSKIDSQTDEDAETNSPPSEGLGEVFAPIDILDYIYAVLHSPTYREKYKEFLKIDFPRVPYPKDKDTFWQLVKLGGEIRQIHLLESPTVEKYITQYPIDGTSEVSKPRFQNSPPSEGCLQDGVVNSPPLDGLGEVRVGSVYINDTQYFDNVPQVAWEFYIGGYQPAQKWLKDRKDRKLEFDDILHYQKIIVALSETDRLMKEIDKIEISGNW